MAPPLPQQCKILHPSYLARAVARGLGDPGATSDCEASSLSPPSLASTPPVFSKPLAFSKLVFGVFS